MVNGSRPSIQLHNEVPSVGVTRCHLVQELHFLMSGFIFSPVRLYVMLRQRGRSLIMVSLQIVYCKNTHYEQARSNPYASFL